MPRVKSQVTDVTTAVLQLGIFAARFIQINLVVHYYEYRSSTILNVAAVHSVLVDNLKSVIVHGHPFEILRAVPNISEQKNLHVLVRVENKSLDEVKFIVAQINHLNRQEIAEKIAFNCLQLCSSDVDELGCERN